ncbi:MAG: hypothetical protein NTY50_05065 [Methylobacter sp.]|nr:hypothetical protein [Methylobacter sp.]
MNNNYKKLTFVKITALLLAFTFSNLVFAGTSEMRATTPGQDCLNRGKTVGIVAAGAVILDCIFLGCAVTLASAAMLPVEIPVAAAVIGTPIVAGASGCAEGAVENVIVNSQ